MKPTPAGWPRISAGVYYADALAMLPWLCRAFGFTEQLKVVDYGEAYWCDRAYGARDPEGHLWWFVQRLRG